MVRDKMYVVPHSHYDAAVFMTREESLDTIYEDIGRIENEFH